MNTCIRSLLLLGGCCVTLAAFTGVAPAQGFYVGADAGVALAEKVDLNRFIFRTPGAKLDFDPGARLSVAGGYNFNPYIGAQIESGMIYNEVKSVFGGGHIDASLSHVPIMADIVVRCDRPDCAWVPFFGAGAGGDVSIISLDHVRVGSGAVDGTDSSVVFAWQAFAGVRYRFTDKMSIGGVYKFYSAEGASWDVRHAAGDIKTDTAQVHSFGIDFTLKF